jgi:hypothetical protein
MAFSFNILIYPHSVIIGQLNDQGHFVMDFGALFGDCNTGDGQTLLQLPRCKGAVQHSVCSTTTLELESVFVLLAEGSES